MAYKNILVHVDESKNAEATIQAACDIAAKSDAHVTGVYVIPHVNTPIYVEASVPASILEGLEKAGQDAADKAEKIFTKKMQSAGCQYEWYSPRGYVDEHINRLGHFADLIVIGQGGSVDEPRVSHTVENNILMGSARPILVVPYIGYKNTIGNHIMVAWNETKEATRAVNDALPLLEKASIVDVLTIINGKTDDDVPAADITLYLARHGVKAEASSTVKKGLTTSDILLNRAADHGVDLIVMGAYGHSRLRELVLGGATHNVLRHMTVPVLMSH
jgi:nucleotide-binding universal stress UspA family protein